MSFVHFDVLQLLFYVSFMYLLFYFIIWLFLESRVYFLQNAWEIIDVRNMDDIEGVKNMPGFDKYMYSVGEWFMHAFLLKKKNNKCFIFWVVGWDVLLWQIKMLICKK